MSLFKDISFIKVNIHLVLIKNRDFLMRKGKVKSELIASKILTCFHNLLAVSY